MTEATCGEANVQELMAEVDHLRATLGPFLRIAKVVYASLQESKAVYDRTDDPLQLGAADIAAMRSIREGVTEIVRSLPTPTDAEEVRKLTEAGLLK